MALLILVFILWLAREEGMNDYIGLAVRLMPKISCTASWVADRGLGLYFAFFRLAET